MTSSKRPLVLALLGGIALLAFALVFLYLQDGKIDLGNTGTMVSGMITTAITVGVVMFFLSRNKGG